MSHPRPVWWKRPYWNFLCWYADYNWLRRLRCRLFYHGPVVTVFLDAERMSHDYCEYCGATLKIHSYRNYLEATWRSSYEELPEEYAPLYEDIRGKGKHP